MATLDSTHVYGLYDVIMSLTIEEVFKVSGIPTHTFVPPSAYARLKVALRTPGRGIIVEGPSGIGKSTAVRNALEELGLARDVLMLSAREPLDAEFIAELPNIKSPGVVIVDDFHRLPATVKHTIADLLKVAADKEDVDTKIVIIGINEAGRALIDAGSDVANRVEVVHFETEPGEKLAAVIEKGEKALNVSIGAKQKIIENSQGSFYITQLLAWNACVEAGITEGQSNTAQVNTSYSAIQRRVVQKQKDRFGATILDFARGTKFRPGGRAPYLHILRWLADAEDWSIHIPSEMKMHPNEKVSVGIVLDRGYLENLAGQLEVAKLMHFDSSTQVLSVEDPMLVYYLRSIPWGEFIREVGFTKVDHEEYYDVALSFAGEDRRFAEEVRDALEDLGLAVFYDNAEQHLLLGEDVEAYLAPIYASGSRYVVAIIGTRYGSKRWTLFESSQFKSRVDAGRVIPIWSVEDSPSAFDVTRERGGMTFDPNGDLRAQAVSISEVIARKIQEG